MLELVYTGNTDDYDTFPVLFTNFSVPGCVSFEALGIWNMRDLLQQ